MNYQIDPQHTTVQFSVRHMMIANVRGVFTKFSGNVDFDPANVGASKVELTIDAASAMTPDQGRNEHIKGPDFFNVAAHPEIKFVSKKVAATGNGDFTVTGDITLLGVTKEAVLNVTGMTDEAKDPWGNLRRGCAASTKISRKDFGMVFNAPLESGGVLVGDNVDIHLDVELLRKP